MTQENKIDDGGPAFPFKCQGSTTAPEFYYGITMRDYFAAKAMQAEISSYTTEASAGAAADAMRLRGEKTAEEHVANLSYRMADAMLKAKKAVKP